MKLHITTVVFTLLAGFLDSPTKKVKNLVDPVKSG